MAVLLVHDDREYVREPGDRLETDLGVLTVPDEPAPGQVVETHLGEPFVVRELRGPDLFAHMERTGAPMMPRDVGLVLGHTGAGGGDRVLDAGTGTGVLAAYLARAGADVVTYEADPEFAAVARENVALAGVADAVEVRTGDVTAELDALAGDAAAPDGDAETSDDGDAGTSDEDAGTSDGESGAPDGGAFDVLTLDTADAPAVVERAPDLLVGGGFVAAYSPFVEDAREVATAARDADLDGVETVETIQRGMDFDDRGSRPSTRGVGHTGYLTFGRAP